jgi:formimidoylglutamate deiminase
MEAAGPDAAMAPHSIRGVPLDYLKEILPYAREHGMRVHMHVAEQPAEVEASLGEYGRRPVELLTDHGVIDSAFTGVHVIHVTNEEAARFGAAGATVCACPTTERNLGDGFGPADELLNAGANICFGTDSNAQINLFEDARQLEYHLRLKKLERAVLAPDDHRESLARRLFINATASGARSIGIGDGTLEPGQPADFFTVDLDDLSIAGADAGSLLTNIVFAAERSAIRDVFVDGKTVIEDRHHRLEAQIVRDFTGLQTRLWL